MLVSRLSPYRLQSRSGLSFLATLALLFLACVLISPYALLAEDSAALTSQTVAAQISGNQTGNQHCSLDSGSITFCPFNRVADSKVLRLRATANVLEPSFTKLANGQGQFRGLISGQGTVHLNLLFFEGERLVLRKYMGYVEIARGETSVPFRFQTPLPKGHQLKWRILASGVS